MQGFQRFDFEHDVLSSDFLALVFAILCLDLDLADLDGVLVWGLLIRGQVRVCRVRGGTLGVAAAVGVLVCAGVGLVLRQVLLDLG